MSRDSGITISPGAGVTRRQLLATHITLFAALGGGALGSTPAPLP